MTDQQREVFDRILTPSFAIDTDQLRTYSMDIRNALSARAMQDQQDAELEGLRMAEAEFLAVVQPVENIPLPNKKRPLTKREHAIIEVALIELCGSQHSLTPWSDIRLRQLNEANPTVLEIDKLLKNLRKNPQAQAEL